MYNVECKAASCTSLGPCPLVGAKEAVITSEEQCTNNLNLWGLIESADNRDIHSTPTAAADQNGEGHHEGGFCFKFQKILCCFNNYR